MARPGIQTFPRNNGTESCVVLLRSNNRRQQLPSNCLWCVGNAGARNGTRWVRRHLRVGHGQIREDNLLASSGWRRQALGSGDRDGPGQGIPVEGRPQGLLEPDLGRCRPRPPAPGHPPGSGRKRAGAPGAAGGRAMRTRAISSPGGPSPKSQGHQEGAGPTIRRIPLPTFRGAPRTLLFLVPAGEDGEPATDVETPTYGHFLGWEVAVIGGIEALQKAHAPPALLPGRRADNTAEEEGLPGRPCDSSQSERRLDHHGPAVDAKQHSPATPHGVELPKLPPQPFFGRFCADMPQYGRAALSSFRAL